MVRATRVLSGHGSHCASISAVVRRTRPDLKIGATVAFRPVRVVVGFVAVGPVAAGRRGQLLVRRARSRRTRTACAISTTIRVGSATASTPMEMTAAGIKTEYMASPYPWSKQWPKERTVNG